MSGSLEQWQGILRGTLSASVDRVVTARAKRAEKAYQLLETSGQAQVADLRRLHAAGEDLKRSFLGRWAGKQVRRNDRKVELTAAEVSLAGTVSGTATAQQALTLIASVSARLNASGIAVFAGTRTIQFDQERNDVVTALNSGVTAEFGALQGISSAVRSKARRLSTEIPKDSAAARALSHSLELPPGIADRITPELSSVVPGIGPLTVQMGFYVDVGPRLSVTEADPSSPWMVNVATADADLAPIVFPALLDLDADGGVVTDSQSAVTSLILRLLALLPPGQLRIDVFDPERLGESVKYLFGLGDAATRVIGENVRSTSRDLHLLLDELEGHITSVTQKYLGAQHRSLHEYNLAAGEVAEPYRLLVLFDYPNGLERASGDVDHDALAQLEKVIAAGPRCGVYTLIVLRSSAPTGRPESWARPAPASPGGLPVLLGQQPRSDIWPMSSRRLPADGAQRPRPGGTWLELADSVATSGKALVFGGTSPLYWLPGDEIDTRSVPARAVIERLEKGLHDASGVEVSPERVAELASQARSDRQRKGISTGPPVALPLQDATWWNGNSAETLIARVGREGSSGVAELRISSDQQFAQVLVGGSPGSGKSTFLHAMLGDLTRTYSPNELELYLLDVKFGVEFRAYLDSPHARVVALESGREFGISVFETLLAKMANRAKLFGDNSVANFADYRAIATRPMPRIVAVIDEFHVLFQIDDAVGERAARALRRLLQQGRAFGIHLVLASQSIAGAPALPRDILGLIPERVVFASSAADSQLLLAEDNIDASRLERAGEGLINLRGGQRGHNNRFQATLFSRDDAAEQTKHLARFARSQGRSFSPAVFDGIREVPFTKKAWSAAVGGSPVDPLTIPIGLPMSLEGPVFATMKRAHAGNLLVIADEKRLCAIGTTVASSAFGNARDVVLLDFGGLGSGLSTAIEPLITLASSRLTANVSQLRGRELVRCLVDEAASVEQKQRDGRYADRARVLILADIERAPIETVPELQSALETLLRDGPAVGVHTVVLANRLASVERKLGYGCLDEFETRVVGRLSRDEAIRILDEPISDMHDEQLVVFQLGTGLLVRAFQAPNPAHWMAP